MSTEPSGVVRPSSRCRRSASQAPPVRMPTMPVASPTWPFIWRTSAWHSPSASGRFIEIGLQDRAGGERVRHVFVLLSPAIGFPEHRFGGGGAEAFVDEPHRNAVAGGELAREAPYARRERVLAAVCREGQSDEQLVGVP